MKKNLMLTGIGVSMLALLSFLITKEKNSFEYGWLAGSWKGDGFGGILEEVWSQPDEHGVMMGMFRHYQADGKLNFYEFLLLDQDGMRLKHFNPNLHAWEEKEDYVTFEMDSFDEQKIQMKGLVIQRVGDEKIELHLDMKKDEKRWTEVLHMQRQ